MPSSLSTSFEQTIRLLETLTKEQSEPLTPALAQAKVVTTDLGDSDHLFDAGAYMGLVVKRALDVH